MRIRQMCMTVVGAALVLALGLAANAATPKSMDAAQGGAEITTPYFSITVPHGWVMPQTVRHMPNGGMAAVFTTENRQVAVAITAMKTPLDAKTIADQTVASMRKGDMEASAPVEVDGFYVVHIEPKTKKAPNTTARSLFGSNGTECAVTTITGVDVQRANEILSALKPTAQGLFPTQIR